MTWKGADTQVNQRIQNNGNVVSMLTNDNKCVGYVVNHTSKKLSKNENNIATLPSEIHLCKDCGHQVVNKMSYASYKEKIASIKSEHQDKAKESKGSSESTSNWKKLSGCKANGEDELEEQGFAGNLKVSKGESKVMSSLYRRSTDNMSYAMSEDVPTCITIHKRDVFYAKFKRVTATAWIESIPAEPPPSLYYIMRTNNCSKVTKQIDVEDNTFVEKKNIIDVT